MTFKLGDRVVIKPPMRELDRAFGSFKIAVELHDQRATVVKEQWFLAFHDVYHVGLFVDDGEYAEIEPEWCQPLGAVELLAEVTNPPPAVKPWPEHQQAQSWWRKGLSTILSFGR